MIDFKKVYFGCADANTEAERNPSTFRKVFFDPHNYLEELVTGNRFILYGRKGDGKTAFNAQIKLTSEQRGFYSHQCSLDDFNNITFEKIKTYSALGGNPYISFWKCILLIECVRMLYAFEPNIQTQDFVEIVDALNKAGFLASDNDLSVTVMKLVESDSTINVRSVFSHNRKYAQETELRGSEQIYSAIRNSIKNIYLNKKFLLIIDGLDDILNSSEFQPDIITGLIRASEDLNRNFKNTTLFIKTIVIIRDDILNLCRDTNLSKIIRDSGIHLSWCFSGNPYASDLIKLVEKRVDAVSGTGGSFSQMWNEVFPNSIGTKDTLEYILDNIIYRPRDILQFFIEAQKEYIAGLQLTEDNIQSALFSYSNEYFVDAMRDELTGFFPNEAVTVLPDILSRMGRRYFFLSDFEAECKKYTEFNNVSPLHILQRLFASGYIGQHRPRTDMDYTVFSYRNPKEKFDAEHECIVHRGLTRALTI